MINPSQHWLDYLQEPHSPTPGKLPLVIDPVLAAHLVTSPAHAATANSSDYWHTYYAIRHGTMLNGHETHNGKSIT